MYQRMCVITTLNQEFRSFLVDTFSTDMPTKKISHRLHTYTHTIRSKTKIIKLCVCVCRICARVTRLILNRHDIKYIF